ncbi:hypothetical protein PPERSA_07294 [Pseudocohnilembus persalinus]|uniref:Transmembrane protein n=1 Tax=Pseudocohnilembus persalinus TaxID=266149 RepID=A0A0V0QGF7_PSEPJ|nr:hypothetical protein PPERSA_07294 [Pseudocohnilembus persalinus]|eukprot:KRX01255.1 hypothetical protein PPERSA_07294 [Pseudocohnilembus persalinus]
MGWEERVPPVPTREQEIQFIENYKDELISQPYYKWHANEAQRPLKLEHGQKLNTNYSHWFRNLLIGFVITGPLLIFPFGRTFHRYNSGVPFWNRPKFAFAAKSQFNQARNWAALKQQIPLWIFASWTYAYWTTDFSILDDENLSQTQSGVARQF